MIVVAAALGLAALAAAGPSGAAPAAAAARPLLLPVPVVRQAPERCGPAALEMVLRYYGADSAAWARAGSAYDPTLRGSLITDLARAARGAGYQAAIESLATDSIVVLLARGIPPILLFQSGVGPITRAHYGVVVGASSAAGERFDLHDGGAPHHMKRSELERRWRPAGHLALIVTPGLALQGSP